MKSVSIKQARQRFAELVETARSGTPIAITRRGRKVAELHGAPGDSPGRLPDLTAFRASLKSARNDKPTTVNELRRGERA